jgi:serine protease
VGDTAPGGDSSIVQTFDLPGDATTLSFWYQIVCPDTVLYDWATATLTDNTTSSTITLLPPTCTNTGTWVQATANVAAMAGHNVTLTLANRDDGFPGDPTYTLYDDVAVTSGAPPYPIINGDFETGDYTGWSRSGVTSISLSAHTGFYAAQLGSANPSFESSISQTFTVPASAGTLSFWYLVHCPDIVYFDWATATLRDNTTSTTITLLPRTCSDTHSWVQVSRNITSMRGHSVTLTLVNHDDNYPGDATSTLYDDVLLQ